MTALVILGVVFVVGLLILLNATQAVRRKPRHATSSDAGTVAWMSGGGGDCVSGSDGGGCDGGGGGGE